jgi:hypothetical protein
MDCISTATQVEALFIDIGFIIFSYLTPRKNPNEFIPLPNVTLYERDRVLTKDIVGSEQEIIQYYRTIMHLCATNNKEIKRSYFWITPILYNSEGLRIDFPYYDTYEDCRGLFINLSSKKEGKIFWDCAEGWAVSIHANNTDFYLREWNPDTGEDYNTIYFPKRLIQAQIPPLMQRTETIISVLTQALGADYWSR